MNIEKVKIAEVLRQYRKINCYSAEYVVNELKKYNLSISAKTIYGYETGVRCPNADMFVALCKIYGIKDIKVFYDDTDENKKTNPTFNIYNSLNSTGKAKADEYITDLSEQKKYTVADADPLVKDIISTAAAEAQTIHNSEHR